MFFSGMIPQSVVIGNEVPTSLFSAKVSDFLCITQCSLSNNVPMWVGWNSTLFEDKLPINKIFYLPQINQPPTSVEVVPETMKRGQKIAEENRKQEICVTYDLGIAKIALQLQEEEAPKFDNIFVVLGGFHIEMAAFVVFGKYIAKSGGPDTLSECHVIEKGSLKSFISGKGYKKN